MPQTEQFDSYGQTSSDFTQNPKNAYQIQPDSKYAYADPALTDFSGIFSITLNSLWIRSMLTEDFGLVVRLCTDWFLWRHKELMEIAVS